MLSRFIIQLRFYSLVCIFLFLNLANLNKLGASSFGVEPSIHLASQKGVFFPSPTKIMVDAKKQLSVSVVSNCDRTTLKGVRHQDQLKRFSVKREHNQHT
jgi:hypothetical protein